MKRRLWIAAVIVSVLCSSMTGLAAVKTMPDGTQFDAAFYAASNPDVAAAIGTDENALYQHYQMFGKAEGRAALATQTAAGNPGAAAVTGAGPIQMPDGGLFDPVFYAATYPDVAAVFGNDAALLYQHYLTAGAAEGRLPYAGTGAVTNTQPAAGGYVDNITEIGHSLWIPNAFKAEPLSPADRKNHYVRYYTAGESVIAVQYINLGVPDFNTLYALLAQAGVSDLEPINVNGTLMLMYENPQALTGSFDTLYNGGVIEITFYPTTSRAMADVAAAVMASFK